jgi:uncharacterized protein
VLAHNVSDLLQAPAGTTRDVSIDETRADLGPELVLVAPVSGRARFHRTQQGILAQVQARTSVQLECSRCLQPFVRDLSTRFTEQFVPFDTPETPEAEGTLDAFRLDSHHVLDLAEPLRQYFTIELPLAPLCKPTCQGLCPVCGEIMEGHRCQGAAPDSSNPFSILADLYRQDETRDSA